MTARPLRFPPVALPLGAGAAARMWPGIVASRKGAARPVGVAPLIADQGQGGRAPRIDAPTGPGPRSRPLRMWLAGGAVLLSTALHGGLVAALVALTGAVPPLADPDIETAEVSMISESQFMAMTAPKPDMPDLAPAMAAPAALTAVADLMLPQAPPMPAPQAPPLRDLAAVTPDPAPVVDDAPKPAATPDEATPPAPPKAASKPKAKTPAPPEKEPQKAAKTQPPAAASAPQKPAKPEAAAAPAAAQGKGEAKALKADWGAKVRARITRKLALPAGAAPGRAKLRVTVTPKGALVSVEIAQSSGQPALDAAAVSAAKAAAPYPRAPKGLTEASYSFVVPIRLDG